MDIQLKSRNGAVPDRLKAYAEKKFNKLGKYFRKVNSVSMEQALERGLHRVELVVEGDGVFLRSEDRCNDMFAAVDNVVNKMETQIKRFKNRLRHDHQRPGPVKAAVAKAIAQQTAKVEGEEPEPFSPRIIRRKRFPMKPMSAYEAAHQMELVSHDFFLFHNEDTGDVNVLYRRKDGDYGLIEPEG
jgi:putative sigma-54 modulation protein